MKTLVRGTTVVLTSLFISMHAVFAQQPDRQDIHRAQVRSYDGVSIPAAWRKPDGEGPFPAILFIHGGVGGSGMEAAVRMLGRRVPAHFYEQGCVVCATDYRRFHFGEDEVQDVLAAYRKLESLPFVDKHRIAVIGGSHGGYLAQMLATRITPAATVSFAGLTDIEGMFYEAGLELRKTVNDWDTWRQQLLTHRQQARNRSADAANARRVPGGNSRLRPGSAGYEVALELGWRYGERRDAFQAISPKEHVDRVKGPILYLVGGEDRLRFAGKAWIEQLKKRGVKAAYSEHADMPHGFYWGNSEHPPRQFFAALQVTTDFVEGQLSEKNSAESFTTEDYYRVDKIDVHAHIRTEEPGFVELAKRDRFRFVNIATQSAGPEEMRMRYFAGYAQLKAHPDRVIFASSFPMSGWNEPDWQEKTIRHLDETFAKGAVAVKVWKNIGMEFRDKDGKLVMIDDPKLDPIFAHLAKKGVRVIGHLGEPRECWLPIERMVMHRGYYASHPEYHMYLHPEMPSYEDQIAARDHMLEKHPDLRFLGAHLGSLEWSVEHLAAFLDRFPKVIVETAARVRDLQYQSSLDREKVRDFLIKYQDRVAYGTDLGVRATVTPDQAIENARRRWLADWNYFATDNLITVRQLEKPVKGLQLPKRVVEKMYRLNAERFFGEAFHDVAKR